ncbi:MAG TPA: hypothetical protein VLB76_01300 [Thermoanaerobaculia bacterium]|nr:hypothetical protein [Thermoanaerobaculia bacterium]
MAVLALVAGVATLPPAPDADPDAYRPVGALNQFQRDDAGERLRLTYGFIDYSGRARHVSCEIDKRVYDSDVTSFGYSEDELNGVVGEGLREVFEREAELREVRPYVRFEIQDGTGYRWRWWAPGGLEPAAADRLEARLRSFDEWMEQDFPRKKEELIGRYLHQRGLRMKRETIEIDYQQAVERDTGPLQDCFEALRQAGEGKSDRRLLGTFLSFFQELRYELPPTVERGRHILGFRPPSAVLVRGAGDCDSKSAAFCALWRHRPERAILILVPGHALVGVEGKPRAGEAYVRLGNRYFVLCEVAGPGKIPPGGSSISGSFEYVMIEPAAG